MELEEVKSHYRNKISELEAAIKQQERKSKNSLLSVLFVADFAAYKIISSIGKCLAGIGTFPVKSWSCANHLDQFTLSQRYYCGCLSNVYYDQLTHVGWLSPGLSGIC